MPPAVEAKNANRSHVRSTLTFRFPGWLLGRAPLYTRSSDPSSGQERRLSCQQCRGDKMCHASQTPFRRDAEHAAGPTARGRWYLNQTLSALVAGRGACRRLGGNRRARLQNVPSFDGLAEDIIVSVRVVGELELGYKLGCVHSVRQKHGGLRCCSSTKVSLSATSWSMSSQCSSSSRGFGCSSQYSWTCFGVMISQAGQKQSG